MTPNDVSDAVVATLKAALGPSVRSIEAHTGIFTDTELGRFGADVPAVRVALVGTGAFGRDSSGAPIVPLRFASVCVARDSVAVGVARVDRRAAVQALAMSVGLAIDRQVFGLSDLYPPEELQARNQYSSKGDRLGLAIWQVTWTTRAIFGEGVDETLAALATLYVNGAPYADPAPIAGADPVAAPGAAAGPQP